MSECRPDYCFQLDIDIVKGYLFINLLSHVLNELKIPSLHSFISFYSKIGPVRFSGKMPTTAKNVPIEFFSLVFSLLIFQSLLFSFFTFFLVSSFLLFPPSLLFALFAFTYPSFLLFSSLLISSPPSLFLGNDH